MEIPADITALRKTDPNLAQTWTLAVRRAFQAAFAAGYRAEGFVRAGAKTAGFYVLRRIPG